MNFPFIGSDPAPPQLVSTVNMSEPMFAVISSGKATYVELQEKLSVLDMYNLLEAITVENFNQRVWHKHQENQR